MPVQQVTHVRHARRYGDRPQFVAGQIKMPQSVNGGERVRVFDLRQLVVGKAQVFERAADSQKRRLRDAADAVIGRRQSVQVEHRDKQTGRQLGDDVVVQKEVFESG